MRAKKSFRTTGTHFGTMKKSLFPLILAYILLWVSGTCFAQSAATVMFASGDVQIVDKDGRARAAIRGGEFGAGETMDTAEGRVQLRFHDGASMSLQPATRFRIDEFRFVDQNGKASPDNKGFFSLIKGGFRTISGLIGKGHREQYKVDTVVATIGIRGTDYSAHLGPSGLEVSTFGGLVEVCSNAGCALVALGETIIVTDRDSLPIRQAKSLEGQGSKPLAPGIQPPLPVELPPADVSPSQPPSAPMPLHEPASVGRIRG